MSAPAGALRPGAGGTPPLLCPEQGKSLKRKTDRGNHPENPCSILDVTAALRAGGRFSLVLLCFPSDLNGDPSQRLVGIRSRWCVATLPRPYGQQRAGQAPAGGSCGTGRSQMRTRVVEFTVSLLAVYDFSVGLMFALDYGNL